MNLIIKSKNKSALKILSVKLEKTGFKVVRESEYEITVPQIGRKSHNYIKLVTKNLSLDFIVKKISNIA